MPKPTEELIQDLVADTRPVTPLQPPLVRALLWIATVAGVFAIVIALTGAAASMVARLSDVPYVLEFTGTLATAIAAILAAMTLSVPGRSDAWALLPLPSALLTLVSTSSMTSAR